MNKVILVGRLTAEPDVTYITGENAMAVGRYTLAVDRRGRNNNGEQTADFIRCVGFGKTGEFIEKYLHKGVKMIVEGHIQTGNYMNKEGQRVYTTDVIIDSQEFAESKSANGGNNSGNTTNKQTAVKSMPAPQYEDEEEGDMPWDV